MFDKPGVVALGCNIHDTMSGFIFVVATPFADEDRRARAGRNWPTCPPARRRSASGIPSIRAAGNMLSQSVAIGAAGFATTIAIRR